MDQRRGIPDQDLNAGIDTSRGMDYKIKEKTAQPGATPAEHATDFDSEMGDPNVNVKQFLNDVEFMDNRGPIGSGD